MKNWTDLVISLALLLLCGVVWQQTALLPESSSGVEFFRPASFPRGVASLLAALALLLLVRSLILLNMLRRQLLAHRAGTTRTA